MFSIKQSSFPLKKELDIHGYSLDDITHVILTHLHFDHAGGATYFNGNKILPTFPNAEYIVSKTNWDAAIRPNQLANRIQQQPERCAALLYRAQCS